MFVIKVNRIGYESSIMQYRFDAPSRKEAQKIFEEWVIHTWFKNKDVEFSLWKEEGFGLVKA